MIFIIIKFNNSFIPSNLSAGKNDQQDLKRFNQINKKILPIFQ